MRMGVTARAAIVVLAIAVGGCAQATGASPGATGAGESEPTPSPSIACPQIDQTPLPPECIPYDPQALMDSNERYRERRPVDPEAFAAFEAERAGVVAVVEELQASGDLSAEAMTGVLLDAGFLYEGPDGVKAFENDDEIVFNGLGPAGGCVFGTVSPTSFEMDIRGSIMDGGCHEAFAH